MGACGMILKNKRAISIFEGYGLYLLTGMVCSCVGASLSSFMEHFQVTLSSVAALTSAFAFGRVATVFLAGFITEHLGPRYTIAAGTAIIVIGVGILPFESSFTIATILIALAGFGMGAQDSACPVLIYNLFPNRYSSAMSAGQAFFGIGGFLPPFIMSILLSTGLSWKWLYYSILILGIIMLLGIPFMEKANIELRNLYLQETSERKGRNRTGLFIVLLIVVFIYCADCNIFHTFTVPYVTYYIGTEEIAVNVLTMYSVGAVTGSILFIGILRKIHTTAAIAVNTLSVTILLFVSMQLKSTIGFFILFTLLGLFNGVIFSLLVTASTEFIPEHAAMAASIIGFVGGIADMGTPLVVGNIVNKSSILGAYKLNILLVTVTFLAAFLLRLSYILAKRADSK
jgi:fucose permease